MPYNTKFMSTRIATNIKKETIVLGKDGREKERLLDGKPIPTKNTIAKAEQDISQPNQQIKGVPPITQEVTQQITPQVTQPITQPVNQNTQAPDEITLIKEKLEAQLKALEQVQALKEELDKKTKEILQ